MAKKVTAHTTTEHIRNFVKCFEKLHNNYNGFTIFSDFLAISALEISNAVNPTDERKQRYTKTLNKYKDDEKKLFADMFACIVAEMHPVAGDIPQYYDVLGELFGGLELHDSWKGQFFTPQPVSDVMARITLREHEEDIEKRGYISSLEPCIGGGANVIGLVNAMFLKGYNPCKQLLVTAYDLDERCIYMSYIQLSLMGIPAMIQQRNTLTNETYGDYWVTPVFVLDDWIGRLRLERLVSIMRGFISDVESNTPAEVPAPAETVVTAEKPAQLVQLSLF